MSDLVTKLRPVVRWPVATVWVTSPVLAAILLIISLFGSANPLAPDFWSFFINIYGVWFYAVCAFVVSGVLLYGATTVTWTLVTLGLTGLMYWRMGEYAHLFREIWVVFGALCALAVMEFLAKATQGSMAMVPPGGEQASRDQEQGSGETAITFRAEKPRYRFADVVGMKDVKERLLEAGKEVVASRKKGGQARNGVLLNGKPGNGKTFMAEALAGELQLRFIAVSFGDVASKYINNTTEHVVKVFRDAARQAPCVLFIDEIDSLISERNSASTYEEAAKTTNAILTELVNIRRTGVFVIGATNFIDRLDPAAVREGRFDFKIEIPAPDSEARRHLITRKCKVPISDETVETAVRRWEGFSVSRISAVLDEASRLGAKDGLMSFEVLQKALRTVQGRKGTIPEDTPTIDQLTMAPENKQRLLSLARRMDKIQEIEAMGGSVPRGVLFYGPPGTGKTLTARALAKSAGWAFISVSGLDLIADPKRITAIVDEASDLRPCIVFIDEADDVFKDRRYSNTATVTNKLLAAMDGANGKVPDILYIAATNHPDEMDAAALRGGRFTEKLEFGLPDTGTVLEFLRKWKAETKAKLAPSFSLEKASQLLAGHSIANIKEILQMAINNAISRIDPAEGVATVEPRDLRMAIQSVQGEFTE